MLERTSNKLVKNPHAVAMGRKGGRIGGPSRAKSLSPRQRSSIARAAARARWGEAQTAVGIPTVERNAARTRERIFRAAAAEFLRFGFEGARVDKIMRRAGVNKRMLYHYFGSKHALFHALMTRNLTTLDDAGTKAPLDTGDSFVYWQELVLHNKSWVRASALEALSPEREWIARREREAFWRAGTDQVRLSQEGGDLDPQLDSAHLQLALAGLVMFPLLLPQFTEMITGIPPEDPAFMARQAPFLRRIAELLGARL